MRILISANSSMAMDEILQFSKQFIQNLNEPLTILKVLDPGTDRHPIRCKSLQEQARQVLGTDHFTVCIRIGQTSDQIIKETHRECYDLVIVGDRRYRWLDRIFTQSDAIQVAEKASSSVMILRGEVGVIQKILFCVSGAESHLVDKFRALLVGLMGPGEEITVLHIMSQISAGPGIHGEQLRSDAAELIKIHAPEGDMFNQDVQLFAQMGIQSIPKVRHGLVVNEILSEAHGGNYDLVVIGASITKRWERFLLDDLMHQLLTRMDRPVLVVR